MTERPDQRSDPAPRLPTRDETDAAITRHAVAHEALAKNRTDATITEVTGATAALMVMFGELRRAAASAPSPQPAPYSCEQRGYVWTVYHRRTEAFHGYNVGDFTTEAEARDLCKRLNDAIALDAEIRPAPATRLAATSTPSQRYATGDEHRFIQTRYRLVNRVCDQRGHTWSVQEFADTPLLGSLCDCGGVMWTAPTEAARGASATASEPLVEDSTGGLHLSSKASAEFNRVVRENYVRAFRRRPSPPRLAAVPAHGGQVSMTPDVRERLKRIVADIRWQAARPEADEPQELREAADFIEASLSAPQQSGEGATTMLTTDTDADGDEYPTGELKRLLDKHSNVSMDAADFDGDRRGHFGALASVEREIIDFIRKCSGQPHREEGTR